MTDQTLPEARVDDRRRISLVWLIPLVALVAALWLGYRAYTEQGPLITIRFETAEGLEAGKTPLRHKDVDVGVVEAIELSPDLAEVWVKARLDASLSGFLTDRTRFWVVRPRLSGGQISGLETVLGGAYIGVDLSREGAEVREFEGLENPPVVSASQPGRSFTLEAEALGSLSIGAPVRFRGIEVGRVADYVLREPSGVDIQVFIEAPFDQKVTREARFWNDSGFQLALDAQGVRLDTESLTTLLLGGISFEIPAGGHDDVRAEEGHRFPLFQDRQAALSPSAGERQRWQLEFAGSVRGLLPGAPVEFRGIRVGEVLRVQLELVPDAGAVRIPVDIALEPARLGMPEADDDPAHRGFWDRLVRDGLRAQLKTGNLLTGALFVDLDFYPSESAQPILWDATPPRLPTVPTALDELRGLVSRLARLPLDQIGQDLSASLAALRTTTESTNDLLQRLDRETATELNRTLGQTRETLAGIEKLLVPSSPLQAEAYRALREFSAAARSFRLMADYLERHPEALIRGKRGEAP